MPVLDYLEPVRCCEECHATLKRMEVKLSAVRGGGNASYDLLIRLLCVGDSGVGKSCLLLRFANDEFSTKFITTIGMDFKLKCVDVVASAPRCSAGTRPDRKGFAESRPSTTEAPL